MLCGKIVKLISKFETLVLIITIFKGMYTPSSGTAYIHGHDIRTHMSRIRSSIGFCPQNKLAKLYDYS